MHKIRFLFYKAKIDGQLLDNAIDSWTWIIGAACLDFKRLKYNYSHVEIQFLDMPLQMCFSSTTRGDWHGTRFAPASEVLKHPERWDYIEAEVDDWQYRKMAELANMEGGKEYDYKGIGGFFWLYNQQDQNKWYCSEICAYLIDSVGLVLGLAVKGEYRISPRRLASILAKKFGEPEPLK